MEDLIAMTETTTCSAAKNPQFSEPQTTTPAINTAAVARELRSHPPRAQSLTAPISNPQTPHTRAASIATSSPVGRKRLSLSFPVLPPGYNPPSRHPPGTPSVSGTTTPTHSGREANPDDSAAFLTALAAQERRVLELKEELSKAETELTKLKRQWATHEANKSRFEIALNSGLTSPTSRGNDALTSPTSRSEFERRQRATNSSRKVLPSQRHQRTLSLLSPERNDFRQPFPRPKDADGDADSRKRLRSPPPIKDSGAVRTQSLEHPDRPKNHDVFLKTGQQIAADFRDGLWTFLEDLKQATVGDDIPRAPPPVARPVRKSSSKASLRGGVALQRKPSRDSRKSRSQERKESLIDFGQDDEPSSCSESNFRWSTDSIISPHSRASTPRTSTSSIDQPIWNTLSATQHQLKKHANALMNQVEKSFTIPPPEPTLARSNSTGCDRFHGVNGEGMRTRTRSDAASREA
ncbi:hypothetical protein FN846DRAFT_973132 [Sphaerosporella brunnea]|uniref:DUF4048 domain-containing protein n=1 Tax=Sphaerosporella brunnea TaxID=1250544 RepID=A0A5J5EG52_9PEZI|nr:hypothetical protein FN846DRAFT_973132 [Sphaerosporella brunnea]